MKKLSNEEKKNQETEAKVTINENRIKILFKSRHHYTKYLLMKRPEIWHVIRPLLTDKSLYLDEHFDPLLENSALTDKDLTDLGVVDAFPLKVLKHPSCGDKTLMRVAQIWHKPDRQKNMDCVTVAAAETQIKRMFELFPPCKHENETLNYANFRNNIKITVF